MSTKNDIQEDEIRVIGGGDKTPQHYPRKWWIWTAIALAGIILTGIMLSVFWKDEPQTPDGQTYFEPQAPSKGSVLNSKKLGRNTNPLMRGYIEIRDTMINDIPLRIYIPHNARMLLHVGVLDKQDANLIFAAQAADIRRDNRKIVGGFVLKGVPLAWGIAKKGYCAIINDEISIGVAENTPLFEAATEKNGYFFRQYPLVDNGKLVENEPKNKSVRRALCDRRGEIMMIESHSNESFHDFAQALVDLGVTNAIYLVGSSSYGWAEDHSGTRIEFGKENANLPKNVSYIIWQRR